MKKIIVFLSIYILSISTSFAQSANNYPKDINSFIDQGKAFIYFDIKSSFELLQELIPIVPGFYRLLVKTFPEISKEIIIEKKNFRPDYLIVFSEDNSLKIKLKCPDNECANALKEYLEKFRNLYSNYLQKSIDVYSKEKLENSTLADLAIVSTSLYSHIKAKKFIETFEISLVEDESAVFLKTKYDNSYFIKSALLNCFAATRDMENNEKYVDYTTLKDKSDKSRCLLNQTFISSAIDDYNHDNEDKMMTTLDIPFLLKTKYLSPDRMLDNNCEYYTEGDLTQGGYIACKIHGSNKRPLYYSNKKSKH